MSNSSQISKILVFRLSSIGDIVLTTALLRCLRNKYPQAQIDFVVKKQFAAILRCVPFVSNVIELDSKKGLTELFALRKQLQKENYDVALDIHKNWRSLFICRTIGAKQVFAFNKHVFRRWVLTTFHKNIYKEVRPVYLRFTDAAKQIGVESDGKYTELVVPSEIQIATDNILQQKGFDTSKPAIALCPGASFKNKQWQPEKFAELAKKIVTELDYQVILIGGKNEQPLCEIIQKEEPLAISFAGEFDLSQSIAALNRVRATVVNDTGMLHASEALGVPVIGIYGATAYPFGYYPILPQSKVADVDLPCRPCTKMGKNSCPKGHFNCMNQLHTQKVFELLQEVLKEK